MRVLVQVHSSSPFNFVATAQLPLLLECVQAALSNLRPNLERSLHIDITPFCVAKPHVQQHMSHVSFTKWFRFLIAIAKGAIDFATLLV